MNSKVFKKLRNAKPINPVLEITKLRYRNSPRVKYNPEALYEFYHPSVNRFPKYSINHELNEFHNIHNFKIYTNNYYKEFLLNIEKSDNMFKKNSDDIEQIVTSCKDSFIHWESFINKVMDSEDYKADKDENKEEKFYNLLKSLYNKLKPVNNKHLPSQQFMRLNYEFINDSSGLAYNIPLNRYNLLLLVHPHWGYFSKFSTKEFSFDDIKNIFNYELVSTYFRDRNKYILANRITAFNLWKQIDVKRQGFLPFNKLKDLLEACAFDYYKDSEEFEKDIKETTEDILKEDIELIQKNQICRFKLFEYIFLERCAL